MTGGDDFDALYAATRRRLLLQTYGLTGDLAAAQAAVRDAFVVGWHHWRKVARADDPEAWLRPVAWSHARVRHSARLFRRDRSTDAELAATLAALHSLPTERRKLLLLAHLSRTDVAGAARELGLAEERARAELGAARAAYAAERGVTEVEVAGSLRPLEGPVDAVRWPRATILRRSGRTRRRSHTAVGSLVGLVATVAAGALVVGPDAVTSVLGPERLGLSAATPSASPEESPAEEPTEASAVETEPQLTVDRLLQRSQLDRLQRGRGWGVRGTTDNTEGRGTVLPCQESRFADPRGRATLLRSFAARDRKGAPAMNAWQLTELSASTRRAKGAFAQMQSWYAGCATPRVQLVSSHRVEGVGDRAELYVLRRWSRPVTTYVVGLARTGQVTTAAVSARADQARPDLDAHQGLLAAAVNGLCGSPGTGACAHPPRLATMAPPPTGLAPGMLSEIDMPPADGVDDAWVGTQPRAALQNVAATQCDRTSFAGGGVSNALTRTFVVPRADLPPEFGLTQTVGTLPAPAAAGFVEEVREKIERCGQRDVGTEVETLASDRDGAGDLIGWRLVIEISDSRKVPYLMGMVRNGTAVSQVGFYPVGERTMGPDAFVALLDRARQRLALMPPPGGDGDKADKGKGDKGEGDERKPSGNGKRR